MVEEDDVEPQTQGDKNIRGAQGMQGGEGIAGPPPADSRVAQKEKPRLQNEDPQ